MPPTATGGAGSKARSPKRVAVRILAAGAKPEQEAEREQKSLPWCRTDGLDLVCDGLSVLFWVVEWMQLLKTQG